MSTPPLPSLKWILGLGSTPLSTATDEFISRSFRIRLQGPTLHLDVEDERLADSSTEAESTVQTYVSTLGRSLGHIFRPKRAGEPWPFLPHVRTTCQYDPPEPRFLERALGEARESVVFDHPTLKHCYRYMSQARAELKAGRLPESLVVVYKLQEAVEKHFGKESQAKRELGLARELDLIGRLANDSRRDVRHPPRRDEAVRPITAEECNSALEAATRLLRAFEQHIRASAAALRSP